MPAINLMGSSGFRLAVIALAAAGLCTAGVSGVAHAAEVDVTGAVTVAGPTAPGVAAQAAPAPAAAAPEENLIPPNVEGAPVQVAGGGYCYGGPHPAPGGGWEAIATPHTHNYAPFDMRLFAQHDGCYYFIGDPRDFGYTGQVYSYYGAHPIADTYGGGWCFMVGGHYHWWRPWSPYFTVVGPWYYWGGPYDPFFWAYWPYYSFYYRSYYPAYYAGGRYYRNGYRVAPAITHVPSTGWRGTPGGAAAANGWRGTPMGAGTQRSSSPLRAGSPAGGGWRGAPGGAPPPAYGAPGGAWRGGAPSGGAPSGGWHGGGAAPPGGGWHGGGAAPPGGGWHGGGGGAAPPGGGWHGAPAGGGWHGGGGGGFRSPGGGFHGGGFHGGRH